MNACSISSALTTGPIVVSWRCSAIGPSRSSSAAASSPSLPSVGMTVLPGAGVGLGLAARAGDGDGDGDGLG